MQTDEMINVQDFCIHHHVELSFIDIVSESGLVEIIQADETQLVPQNQLPQLERLVRLYYEMNINIEGIETITHLLNRLNDMRQEIVLLNNQLRFYENERE